MLPYGQLPAQLPKVASGFYVPPTSPNTYYNVTSVGTANWDVLTYAYGEMYVPTGVCKITFSAPANPINNSALYGGLLVDGVNSYVSGYQYHNAAGWVKMLQWQFLIAGLDPNKKHTFQARAATTGAGQSVYVYQGNSLWGCGFWGFTLPDWKAF